MNSMFMEQGNFFTKSLINCNYFRITINGITQLKPFEFALEYSDTIEINVSASLRDEIMNIGLFKDKNYIKVCSAKAANIF